MFFCDRSLSEFFLAFGEWPCTTESVIAPRTWSLFYLIWQIFEFSCYSRPFDKHNYILCVASCNPPKFRLRDISLGCKKENGASCFPTASRLRSTGQTVGPTWKWHYTHRRLSMFIRMRTPSPPVPMHEIWCIISVDLALICLNVSVTQEIVQRSRTDRALLAHVWVFSCLGSREKHSSDTLSHIFTWSDTQRIHRPPW